MNKTHRHREYEVETGFVQGFIGTASFRISWCWDPTTSKIRTLSESCDNHRVLVSGVGISKKDPLSFLPSLPCLLLRCYMLVLIDAGGNIGAILG